MSKKKDPFVELLVRSKNPKYIVARAIAEYYGKSVDKAVRKAFNLEIIRRVNKKMIEQHRSGILK